MFYFKKPCPINPIIDRKTYKLFRRLRRYSFGYYVGLMGLIILAIINFFKPSAVGSLGIIMICIGYHSLHKLFEYEQDCVSVLLDEDEKKTKKKRSAMKC